MPTTTSNAAFNQAADVDVQNLKQKPNNDQLLELYALYKIGCGDDITTAPAPGMFALAEKAKRAKWQAKVDEGLTVETAQAAYIAYVKQLQEDIGVKE